MLQDWQNGTNSAFPFEPALRAPARHLQACACSDNPPSKAFSCQQQKVGQPRSPMRPPRALRCCLPRMHGRLPRPMLPSAGHGQVRRGLDEGLLSVYVRDVPVLAHAVVGQLHHSSRRRRLGILRQRGDIRALGPAFDMLNRWQSYLAAVQVETETILLASRVRTCRSCRWGKCRNLRTH